MLTEFRRVILLASLVLQFGLCQGTAVAQHRDHAMTHEHARALDLVRESNVTTRAVRNGNWSNPSVWSNGIPGRDSRAQVPAGVIVIYDVNSSAALKTLRIDGQLRFKTDIRTTLVVDTVFANSGSVLVVGTAANPVRSGVSARILINNSGPIDTAWDPLRLSRGLILHGKTIMHGEVKTSFLAVTNQPKRGATRLRLERAPKRWRVGDRIVLTGANFRELGYNAGTGARYLGTYDEVRTIRAIRGNVVTVDPLQFDHTTPKANLPVYVANYTRNISVETLGRAGVPKQQRGHVMFMHTRDVSINYVAFVELGRSDKSILVNDAEFDTNGRLVAGTGSNQRGRYAVHVHRAGTDTAPALIRGSAVYGSPGWGFVNHESNAVMEDNASYNVVGAHFVTENGTELGAFRRNIAIKSGGYTAGLFGAAAKDGTRVQHFDLGHSGHGFWLQGRLVSVVGNVAAGHANAAYELMHRGDNRADNQIHSRMLKYPDIIKMKEAYVPFTKVNSYFNYDRAPIRDFKDNTAMGSYLGLQIIKANNDQHHDQRNIIDGFTGIFNAGGISLTYTAKYTLKDVYLVAAKGARLSELVGAELATTTSEFVFERLTIANYRHGLEVEGDVRPEILLIDARFPGVTHRFVNHHRQPVTLDAASKQVMLTASQVQSHPLRLRVDDGQSYTMSDLGQDFVISGTKQDGYGTFPYKEYFSRYAICNVPFYTKPGGARVLHLKALYFDRKTNACRAHRFELVSPCYGPGGINDWSYAVNKGRAPQIDARDTSCPRN